MAKSLVSCFFWLTVYVHVNRWAYFSVGNRNSRTLMIICTHTECSTCSPTCLSQCWVQSNRAIRRREHTAGSWYLQNLPSEWTAELSLTKHNVSTTATISWQQAMKQHTRLTAPLSGTTRVSRYQKGKTNLDFTEARDSELQWHQLGHMQVCT